MSGDRPGGRPRQYDEDALVAAVAASDDPDVVLDDVHAALIDAGTSPRVALFARRWLRELAHGTDPATYSRTSAAKYRAALATVADELPTRPRRRRVAA
jgi:hypothetical protein